jgi:hypothetical protein
MGSSHRLGWSNHYPHGPSEAPDLEKSGIKVKIMWGIKPDKSKPISFGARAIYHRPGSIDLVSDRREIVGGTEDQQRQLAKWLVEYGIPAIEKLSDDEYLCVHEDRRVTLALHGWLITINPQNSYGYLYIGVWPEDNEDPNFFPDPVPSPSNKVRRLKKTRCGN